MTQLRWTTPASNDFFGIVEWITAENPGAARRVGQRILDAAESLLAHPYLGKPGRVADTRELVVTRYPYLIVYEIEPASGSRGQPETVVILRVLHGAMLWPPASP
jgi:plasmid stabilization system protein ParE